MCSLPRSFYPLPTHVASSRTAAAASGSPGGRRPAAHRLLALVAALLLLGSSIAEALTLTVATKAAPLRLRVDATRSLGSATVLADYLNVQGMVRDLGTFELAAWRDLSQVRLGTDSVPLLNDEWYMGEGGIFVLRAASKQDPAWRGPYGPQSDLWLDVGEFERYRRALRQRLGLRDERINYGLGLTPRTLCWDPASPHCFAMAPRDYDEWADLMRGVAEYLASVGLTGIRMSFYGEPENLYHGKGRPSSTAPEVVADYAEHYYVTHEAIRAVLPQATLSAPAHGTAAEEHTRTLQANPEQWGLESFLAALDAIDPTFIPEKMTALGVQGYLFEELVDGTSDFRWAIGHVRAVLAAHAGARRIPIEVHGWNGTWVLERPTDPEAVRLRHLQEACFMAASTFDFLNLGGERGYDVGYYYTWNLDDTCQFPANLVHTEHDADPPWDPSRPHCFTPASAVSCVTAPYRAMQILEALRKGGDFVPTTGGERRDLVVAAVAGAGGAAPVAQVMVADRLGGPLGELLIELRGLTPGQTLRPRVRTIGNDDELCAETAEVELPAVRVSRQGRVQVRLPTQSAGLLHLVLGR